MYNRKISKTEENLLDSLWREIDSARQSADLAAAQSEHLSAAQPTPQSAHQFAAEAADHSAKQSAGQPVAQSAHQSAAKPAAQSEHLSAAQPTPQSAHQFAAEAADHSAKQSAGQPVAQSAHQSAAKPAAQSEHLSAAQPTPQSAHQFAAEAADHSAKQSAGQPVAQSAHQSAAKPAAQSEHLSAAQPTPQSAHQFAAEAADHSAKQSAGQPVAQSAHQPAATSDISNKDTIRRTGLQDLRSRIKRAGQQRARRIRNWLYASVAAIVILLIIIPLQIRYIDKQIEAPLLSLKALGVEVANESVSLRMENDIAMALSDSAYISPTTESGISIICSQGVEVEIGSERWLRLEVPTGKQFRLKLSDGTSIILNAASTLDYPATFDGSSEREVRLSGEALFDVAKDSKRPFIVRLDNGESIRVLGTTFNVNAYSDNEFNVTTLLSGKISYSREDADEDIILQPSQQIRVSRTQEIGGASANSDTVDSIGVYANSNLEPSTNEDICGLESTDKIDDIILSYSGISNGVSPKSASRRSDSSRNAEKDYIGTSWAEVRNLEGSDAATDWTGRIISFENEKLPSIAKKLSRMYGIEIIVGEHLRDRAFSGRINYDKGVDFITRLMKETSGISCTVREGKILLN